MTATPRGALLVGSVPLENNTRFFAPQRRFWEIISNAFRMGDR